MSETVPADPRIAHYAALQSVTEIGLGSLVHGLRLPLGGHFLSLNQGVLLTFAVRPVAGAPVRLARGRGAAIAWGVSFIAAAMKFLSPAGARLMPAIGISLQGLLFSGGIYLFGLNRFGVCFGAALASIWAFLHPLVFGYLIFGETLFYAVVKLWTDIATKLGFPVELGVWILIGAVAVKLGLAIGLSLFSWSADEGAESRYVTKVSRFTKSFRRPPEQVVLSPLRGVVRDLTRPIFLVSLVLSVAFVFAAGRGTADAAIYLARIVGIAGLLFYSIRAFPKSWAVAIKARFPALAQTAAEVSRSRT